MTYWHFEEDAQSEKVRITGDASVLREERRSVSQSEFLSPPHTQEELAFYQAEHFVQTRKPQGAAAAIYLRTQFFIEEEQQVRDYEEALAGLQRRQATEMDLVVMQGGVKPREISQTKADVSALANHHVSEIDSLENFWKQKMTKTRVEQRKMYRSLITDLGAQSCSRKIHVDDQIISQTRTSGERRCDPGADFLVAVGRRVVVLRLTTNGGGPDLETRMEIDGSDWVGAAVRWTADTNFRSTDDRQFIATCEARNEIKWPEISDQLKTIAETAARNNHTLAAGDWVTTRHSNLEGNVALVFHIFKGGHDARALGEILTVCDANQVRQVSMRLGHENQFPAFVEAVAGLPERGALKLVNAEIAKTSVETLGRLISHSLLCIHNPLTA